MFKSRGFSFIELIIVIAVIGTLSAIVALPFNRFRNRQALQNSSSGLISFLNDARTKTLASTGDTIYGVHIQSTKAVLFSGSTYNQNTTTNENFIFDDPVTETALSLQGGGSEIIFDRLKGSTADYGTITLSLPSGESRIITVSSTGTITRN